MPKQAIELMFNSYRRKLLAQLLLRPDEDFHVRELERMTGVPAGSLHRELRALADAGLLLKRPVGNQLRYQADRGSPVFDELASIFRKTMGLADILREVLAAFSGKINVAFVFGSMATGKQKPGSDLDLFILGKVSLLEVVSALAQAKGSLAREVNPVVMTRSEFESAKEKGDRFIEHVLSEPKIFVIGDASVVREPGQDRAAH